MWSEQNVMPSIDMRFMTGDSKEKLENAGINIFQKNSGVAANFDGAKVDLEELRKYAKIVLFTEIVENNIPRYFRTNFRNCKKEDFEKRGIALD